MVAQSAGGLRELATGILLSVPAALQAATVLMDCLSLSRGGDQMVLAATVAGTAVALCACGQAPLFAISAHRLDVPPEQLGAAWRDCLRLATRLGVACAALLMVAGLLAAHRHHSLLGDPWAAVLRAVATIPASISAVSAAAVLRRGWAMAWSSHLLVAGAVWMATQALLVRCLLSAADQAQMASSLAALVAATYTAAGGWKLASSACRQGRVSPCRPVRTERRGRSMPAELLPLLGMGLSFHLAMLCIYLGVGADGRLPFAKVALAVDALVLTACPIYGLCSLLLARGRRAAGPPPSFPPSAGCLALGAGLGAAMALLALTTLAAALQVPTLSVAARALLSAVPARARWCLAGSLPLEAVGAVGTTLLVARGHAVSAAGGQILAHWMGLVGPVTLLNAGQALSLETFWFLYAGWRALQASAVVLCLVRCRAWT